MRRAAAISACSLLLLLPTLSEAAASKPARAGKSTAVAAKKSRVPKKAGPSAPGPDVFVAEVDDDEDFGLKGHASFYGSGFQGRKTSTGERFDVRQFSAASNRFALGSLVAVRRLDDGRCAIVKINDRMHEKHRKRVIDVSRATAEYLGMIRAGVVLVRVAAVRDHHGSGQSDQACQAAFEPEIPCMSCDKPPQLPNFQAGMTD